MPKFLVLYNSSVPANELMTSATPEQVQSGMDAWTQRPEKWGGG
jgi:hypothetical protein